MSPLPETIWIVHADPDARALLRQLAGRAASLAGAPAELALESAPAPRAVVLHVGPDLPAALDFAQRVRRLHPRAAFVLLRDERVPAATLAEACADLGAELLAWPSEAEQLPAALARAGHAAPTSLHARRERDALVRRFVRTLGDLGLPDLGGLQSARLVIRGEPGAGKLLVARVIHALADPPGALVYLACAEAAALRELADRLAAATQAERVVVCLDQPNRLTREQQRELAGWIELGPPGLALDPERTVWIALLTSLADAVPLLEPTLGLVLRGHELVLPPLRQRPDAAERFAASTLRSLAEAAGQPVRQLSSEALARIRGALWPGNFRELEAALRRVMTLGGPESIGPELLDLPEAPPAPLPAPAQRPRRALPPAPAAAAAPIVAAAPSAAASRAEARPPVPAVAEPASRDLLQSLAHSLRNPLVSLKTFAELLPEQFADAEFRGRFREQAARDLASVERQLDRLARFAGLAPGPRKPVNVAALLDALLQERRSEIRQRRLLVLSELGADAPWALGSEEVLRFSFEALFAATFARISDRQDLYVACRRPAARAGEAGMLRILLRFHGAPIARLPGRGEPAPAALELVLAEAALRTQGGRLALESLASDEQVVRVDLPVAGSGEEQSGV